MESEFPDEDFDMSYDFCHCEQKRSKKRITLPNIIKIYFF